jgi:acetoin utilization deacetylase AcuC-like enzyme
MISLPSFACRFCLCDQHLLHCTSLEFRKSPLATIQQLSTTHDPTYISRYLSGELTERENRNIGFPWSEQHVNRSLSSVGGTVNAALSSWEEFVRRRTFDVEQQQCNIQRDVVNIQERNHLCWGAHVAGGTHHAFYDYGEGFCIFSDIAVAANVLLQTYGEQTQRAKKNPISAIRRILIIDLDVHQGNGNAALFSGNERIKTFSMHCVANYFSEKQHSDLDVELPVGCDDETYLSTLRHWLSAIENHNFDKGEDRKQKQFDLIFYQAGVDIHYADRLGKLSVTQKGISRRNSLVFDFAYKMGSPLIISMGGGYPKGDDWTPILDAHTSVYWEAHQFLAAASSFQGVTADNTSSCR